MLINLIKLDNKLSMAKELKRFVLKGKILGKGNKLEVLATSDKIAELETISEHFSKIVAGMEYDFKKINEIGGSLNIKNLQRNIKSLHEIQRSSIIVMDINKLYLPSPKGTEDQGRYFAVRALEISENARKSRYR